MATMVDTPPLTRLQLDPLAPAEAFWHCHRSDQTPTEFGDGQWRFAAHEAAPPRRMYWVGSSPSASLWETALRHIVASVDGDEVVLPDRLISGRLLTSIQSTCVLEVLSLYVTPLRALVAKRDDVDEWMFLTHSPKPEPTHSPAAALLAQAESASMVLHGLRWASRQTGSPHNQPIAYVFYEGPAGPHAFKATGEPVALDSPDGRAYIVKALAEAGLRLADMSPATQRLMAERASDAVPLVDVDSQA